MDTEGTSLESCHLDKQNIRTIARMLLLPTKSEASILRRRFATGIDDAPYEALITSQRDRFLSSVRLLRAMHAFIPLARAPPVSLLILQFHSQLPEIVLFYLVYNCHWLPCIVAIHFGINSFLVDTDICSMFGHKLCLPSRRRTLSSLDDEIVSWICSHL